MGVGGRAPGRLYFPISGDRIFGLASWGVVCILYLESCVFYSGHAQHLREEDCGKWDVVRAAQGKNETVKSS